MEKGDSIMEDVGRVKRQMTRPLDDEKIISILKGYVLYDGNAARTTRELNRSGICLKYPAVVKYWRLAGYEIRKRGGNNNPAGNRSRPKRRRKGAAYDEPFM